MQWSRVWFGNIDALRFELVDLVAQASNRNPQGDGRPGSVAFEMIEGLDNEFALNFRNRVANELLKNRGLKRSRLIANDSFR